VKDSGIVWSRDCTKINCLRGSDKVSNYILPQKTLNFNHMEWDFSIHSSKRPLTFIYFCLLLTYRNTIAFYQQPSQETNIFMSNRSVVKGVCKSRNPIRNTRTLPGTTHGTSWNTSYEATHVFLYKFTCFALNSG
jgi:hypothetical protein